MLKSLARLFSFEGYFVKDYQVSTRDKTLRVILERNPEKLGKCYRCGGFLGRKRGQHPRRVEHLPALGFKTFVEYWQYKGHCGQCNKARNEYVSFASKDTKKFTKEYAEWLGTMCEFAAVSRVAKFESHTKGTLRDLDYERLKRLLKEYKIPEVTHISVDEVYAFNTPLDKHETRDDRFLTVISDLNTRKIIWVSEGRSKEALDQFYILLGKKACKKIVVAAMDQFDGYALSTRQHCKNAKIVWDRFHIMKSLEEAVNDERKKLHEDLENKDPLVPLTKGKNRFIFLKRSDRRTEEETTLIETVCRENGKFVQLELIKEAMFQFFSQPTESDAKDLLDAVTKMAWETSFDGLKNWFHRMQESWDTLKNYFEFRVTSAVSEGINNVIKALKRRAYGYRNPDYFRYKIMQQCGYLTSDFVKLAR